MLPEKGERRAWLPTLTELLSAVSATLMAALCTSSPSRPGARPFLLLLLPPLLPGITASLPQAHEIYPPPNAISVALPIRIGVLANRGRDECIRRWKPTAAYQEHHLGRSRWS
jgi:ABC-type phosphate/phosphonate transport system substrate-binding protein